MERCGWAGPEQIYLDYHDTEWGVPERDSRALWEKLVLDGFQAGLSWITILKKRDNFRAAFAGFDPDVIAGWGEAEVARLLEDPGIVRHRGKIEATIGNARAWQRIEAERGFDRFLWDHVAGRPIQNRWTGPAEVPARTALSERISKQLKQAGFRFCGPTIVYAFMQAVGMVNDHLVTCPRHGELARPDRAG
ncbi:MAG: DNA-3-methyladenine glycosylase I [Rhodobacteraceae bacterium]|nr:DNA-3-methyladenine glycosylase I [Paracoccaceae bacterium]